MFANLGSWCYRHRVRVVLLWLAALVVGATLSGAVGTDLRSEFTLPDVESRRGTDILEDHFGGQGAGQAGSVVFRSDRGVDDPEVEAAVTEFLDKLDARDEVTVVSPYEPGNESQIAQTGDDAGLIAYAQVEVPADMSWEETLAMGEDVRDDLPEIDGLQIELGGQIFAEFEVPDSEFLGLGFAIIILILAFGSVLAMGLPVGVALTGIGLGVLTVGLVSNFMSVPEFTTTLGAMIGLGVGIDYALFIVTRYRENMHAGHSTAHAVRVALDTAGRAVAFAGTTVVISLLGMLIMNVGFVSGLAVGAAVVVVFTMIASLTLLPALLGFAGERVEVTRWRGLVAAGLVAVALVGLGLKIQPLIIGLPLALVVLIASLAIAPLRREVRRRPRPPIRETASYRWSRLVQHHSWPAVLLGSAVLLLLAVPVLGLRLGVADEGNYPEDTTTRQAYDLLSDGFGPGFNGPLLLTTELPEGTDPAALEAITQALESDPGVAQTSPAILNDPDDSTAGLWRVIPTTAPQEVETTELVDRLRSVVIPEAEAGTGLDIAVTGTVAINADFSDYLAGRLVWFFGAVLGISFLLLMVVFRSVLVPLKAVVMNLLSIGAAFGIIVAIFQWGWGAELLGIDGGPIEPFLPMMLFAIVFGLSMDYEVFLLSRMKEEWDRTGDSRTSVADGLAATARVITAAAAIMVFVFGSFLLENDRVSKLFGAGLAIAVLLDATIIRMLLVPATMELLGDRNWWLPKWLDRLLPHVELESDVDQEPDEPEKGDPDDQPDAQLQPVG